jgi:hypothetical protein
MADQAAALERDGEGLTLGLQLQVDQWQGTVRPQVQLEQMAKPVGKESVLQCGPGCPWWALHDLPVDLSLPGSEGHSRGDPSSRRLEPALTGPLCLEFENPCNNEGTNGRLSVVARVLSTGEPVTIVGCSSPDLRRDLCAGLPMEDLAHRPIECLGRGCGFGRAAALPENGVVVAEWDALWLLLKCDLKPVHVVLASPPYRLGHVDALRELREGGVTFHLAYGDEERRSTAALLRYVAHPRFAMVCMYRAAESGLRGRDQLAEAARLAVAESGAGLAMDDLALARYTLSQIGLGPADRKQAKMEARDVPAYAAAEAEFEESVRLCQIL